MISTASSRAPRSSADEDAGRLLDGVLGRARDAQQRALGHVAGQPDHQHRVEREIDLLHLRLVDVARQIVLGGVDLGTHVGERRLGIETGLELEQHIAAALIGGGAHLLDVTDRLELGLDRPQQQPLGILRADAALGELHEDDRDADVGFRFLRDRHIGDGARDQQEHQRRDRQPCMADGVVDKTEHLDLSFSRSCVSSIPPRCGRHRNPMAVSGARGRPPTPHRVFPGRPSASG